MVTKTLAADTIGLSSADWEDHAFVVDNGGRAVWRARCGHAVLCDRVDEPSGTVPTCRGCIAPWLKAILEQGAAEVAHLEGTFGKGFIPGLSDGTG